MKKLIQLITLSAVAATFALPALAQNATASPSPAATAQGSQEDEATKTALYQKVMDNYKNNQPVAYEAAKEYLQKYPNETDAARMKWLQNFVAKYDKAKVQTGFPKLIADKKYSEAFATGKQMLTTDPENLSVLMNLGYAGYSAAAFDKNEAFVGEGANYAKRAIQLIESGKTPESWTPFPSKDEALAWLNYALGYSTLKTDQSEAINYFTKAAQYNSPVKSASLTYYYMALAYEAGPYKKQSDAMAIYENKPETPESKAALESLNQTADRVIDAYARAVAYSTDPKAQADKAKWMARLTELYKFRHNGSDAGLNELIANVRNTPIPTGAPTATTPATTPASGATSATDSGAATGTTTTTDTNGTGATSTPATTTTTTPASTTQPGSTTTTPATTTTPSGNPKATTTTPTTTQPANKPKP